jgi:uncharacterized protein with HEPN domain
MLPDIKNDLLYLLNVLENIEKIFLYSKDTKTAEEFYYKDDQINFNASLNLLAQSGESITKISNELKEKNLNIKWNEIKGLRNKITHEYLGLDIFILYKIILNDLPELKVNIIGIIKKYLKEKIFDIDELNTIKGSYYYRHINIEGM